MIADNIAKGDLVTFRNGITVMQVMFVEGDVAYCKVYPVSSPDEPGVFVPFDLLSVIDDGNGGPPVFH